MTIAAVCGPRMIPKRDGPPCPLVPGIAGSWKFTICAANKRSQNTHQSKLIRSQKPPSFSADNAQAGGGYRECSCSYRNR